MAHGEDALMRRLRLMKRRRCPTLREFIALAFLGWRRTAPSNEPTREELIEAAMEALAAVEAPESIAPALSSPAHGEGDGLSVNQVGRVTVLVELRDFPPQTIANVYPKERRRGDG